MKLPACIRFGALLTVIALAAGCPKNQYVIEMKPSLESLERTLTCWREDGVTPDGTPNYIEFPREELARLSKTFAQQEVSGKKHRFAGRFGPDLPNDVGGKGAYSVFPNTLGTSFVYLERFRGADDLHATIQERLDSSEQLANLFLGWSREALGREPGYDGLRRFLNSDFRNDLRNMALYSWLAGIAESRNPGALEEFGVRMGQFLAERGYWSARDLPTVLRSAQDTSVLLPLLQRFLASKLGVAPGRNVPPSLAFIAEPAALKASVEKFLQGTPEFRTRLKKWEADGKPENQAPDPLEILTDPLGVMIQSPVGDGGDRLTLRLNLRTAPARTNGKWDEQSRQVTWEASIENQSPFRDLPMICHAQWSVPNADKQREHFGKPILTGRDLVDYCLWHKGLGPDHAREWDELISTLEPDTALARIQTFRFAPKKDRNNPQTTLDPDSDQAPDPALAARELFARLLKD